MINIYNSQSQSAKFTDTKLTELDSIEEEDHTDTETNKKMNEEF